MNVISDQVRSRSGRVVKFTKYSTNEFECSNDNICYSNDDVGKEGSKQRKTHNLSMGIKYSWEEDVQAWKASITNRIEETAQALGRTIASVSCRLQELRRIKTRACDAASDGISLAEELNHMIWNIKQQESAISNQYSIRQIAFNCGITTNSAVRRLQQIRDVKHYLYFADIHSDESVTPVNKRKKRKYTEEPTPAQSEPGESTAKFEQCESTTPPLHNLQVLFGCMNDHSASTFESVHDLAESMGLHLDQVKRQMAKITSLERSAALAVAEGVTLLPGPDTALWRAYTQAFRARCMGKSYTALRVDSFCIPIKDVLTRQLAEENRTTPAQIGLRLRLIQSIKKFLHIADLHADDVNTLDLVISPDLGCDITAGSQSTSTSANWCELAQSQASEAPITLSLDQCVFAFTSSQEASLWRVFTTHRAGWSEQTAPTYLQPQVDLFGCTLPQITQHLQYLIDLSLGRTTQSHSTNRLFTTAEDELILEALLQSTAVNFTLTLVRVAEQVGCPVQNVARRFNQLKTLRILETVPIDG